MNNENLENSTKSEKNENNNQSSIKFNNSIELLDEMEKIYLYPENNIINNLSQLNNAKNNFKFDSIKVINSIPKTSLNSLIFKKGVIITSIAIKLNSIYIGTNKGEIRAYSWKTEKKLNFYISPDIIKEEKKDVICMDVTDDNKALVVGYLNGFILLWDVDTSECKKIMNDLFYSQITDIKFTLYENKFYEFLASDNKGKVKRISVSEGFFYNSVNSSNIIEYNKAITVIEILKLTEEQKIITKKYIKRDDQEELLVVAFGSLDKIFFVQIEPVIKNLFTFNKPEYIPYFFSPNICFGLGRIPAPFIYDGDFSEEISKNVNIKKDLNIKTSTKLNLNNEYQLIYISWGKILNVFILSFDLSNFLDIYKVGYYINKEPIIRMGFLSKNIIYLMDIYKKFKIVNSAFINSGEIETNSQGNIINKNLYNSELCTEYELDYTILFQSYLTENDKDSIYRSSYNQLIYTQDKSFFIACKRYIYLGVLLNWEQCVNELYKNSNNKLEAFNLCINIYHGNIKILDGIPLKTKERKENVKRLLKGLILQLILNIINIKDFFFSPEKSREILTNCLNVAIELCLDVGEINFVFKEISKSMEEKGYFDFFMEKVKPFIMNNKITSSLLGQEITTKIIKYYIGIKDYATVSRIIINIDVKNFDIKEIKEVCYSNNLIVPLIYIYFKFYEENIFSLVIKLYELFNKAYNITRVEYEEYKKIIINKKIEHMDEILVSKQYLGQKLLWLINLCLKGNKYPSLEPISKNLYSTLIQSIFLWLTNDEILTNLLKFDSYTFFNIYSKFYTENYLLNIIKSIGKESQLSSELNVDKNLIDNFELKKINEDIINKVICMKNILIEDDLNEYILKINCKEQILSIDCIINSIKYILNFKDFQSQREQSDDYFEYHNKSLNDEKIEFYSNIINLVLENNKEKIKKDILNQILYISEKNEFPLVTIKIYELLNENIKSLDIFLSNDKVNNKEEEMFLFIDKFMSKSVKSELQKYKIELINRIDKLVEKNVDKSLDISLKWLNDEQIKIINKIPVKDGKKLEYIDKYVKYYINISNESNGDESKIIKDKNFNKILITQIDILAKLNKIDDIIKLVKSNSSYINEDCLKICLKYNIIEAVIYIYIKQENYIKALEICKKDLTNILENLMKINGDKSSETETEIIKKYDELINKILLICEKEDKEKVWFDAFDFLFNKLKMLDSKEAIDNKNLENIKSKISNDINHLILSMHSHISMKNFLEKILKKTQIYEFKSLNSILDKFIKEQLIFQNILSNSISLLDFSLDNNFKKKKKLINKGMFYKIDKCNFCLKDLKEEDIIIIYNCGHILHNKEPCVINNKECKICFLENEKITIGSINVQNKNIIISNEENNIQNIVINAEDKNKDKKNINDIYYKINNIEETFRNRKSYIEKNINFENMKAKKSINKKENN